MNDTTRGSRPSILPSLRPSGIFTMELPFGQPPDRVLESTPQKLVGEDLRRTVRALSNNAGKILHRSPLTAAMCWHEAGRLLERRAERPGEAWVCFSRALAVFPDYRPALLGLIRIARSFGADEVLLGLLDALIDRVNEASEKTALLTEAAAVLIRMGDAVGAKKKLKTAVALSDKAMVPRILAAVISSAPAVEKDVWSMIAPLYESTKGTRLSASLARFAAEKEDRRSKEPILGVRPEDVFTDEESLSILWIQFRTHLRRGLMVEAEKALEKMSGKADDRLLERAVSHLLSILRRMNGSRVTKTNENEDDAFSHMVETFLDDDRDHAPAAVQKFRREVRHGGLKDGLALIQMVEERRSSLPLLYSFGPSGVTTPTAKALFRFLKAEASKEIRDPAADATLLKRAVTDGDYPALIEILRRLREETIDADAKWPLKVAECALELELKPQDHSPSSLSGDEAYYTPLPSMMRRAETRHRRLAELCQGEARNSEDPHFVASRLAWAGFHLETLDPFESARLYTEALSCNPSLIFAVKGLERTGTMGKEAAVLFRCAAEASRDESNRAAALLREGMLHLSFKKPAEAASSICEAATLLPKDEALQRIAYSFASSYPKRYPRSYTAALFDGTLKGVHPFLIGALSLFTRPDIACARFEEALQSQPNDPLAKLGRTEALLRSGRASIVSEGLFENLKQVSKDAEKGAVYQRLAHIDRFYHQDEPSAAMFQEALFGLLPGHRSSIVNLAIYALKKQRLDDWRRSLTALSLTTSVADDARVYASLCTLGDPSDTDLVKYIAAHSKPTLLELTFLEGVTDDAGLRLFLLEKICSINPMSRTYLSRFADALAEAGRFEEAVPLFKQSLESRLTVCHNLHRMSECLRETDAHPLLVDTLTIAADTWTVGAFKAKVLYEAAVLALEAVHDPVKSADLCLLALQADPEEDSAFRLADSLFENEAYDPVLWLRLLETRLTGYCDPIDEIVIRAKVLRLLKASDSEAAQSHILATVASVLDNRPVQESPDDDRVAAWDEAIWSALDSLKQASKQALKLTTDGSSYAALLASLGQLYLREYRNETIAEQYFQEAISQDVACSQALGGLAEILRGRGDSVEASRLLERCVASSSDPKEKLEKLLINAAILKDNLNNEKEAEQVLKEARKTAPFDLSAIESLADIYEKQADAGALSILLDSAFQHHGTRLTKEPDNIATYQNLLAIGKRKGEKIVVRMAEDMIAFLETNAGRPSDRPSDRRWSLRPGTNMADPSLDERLCPAAVSAAIRKIFAVLEAPLGRMLGVSSDQMNLESFEKPKRRDKVTQVVSKLAPMFGMAAPEIRVGLTPDLRIAPGSSPVILMPEAVLKSDILGVKMFAAAAALEWIRLGLSITTCVPLSRLRRVLCGLGRIYNPDFRPKGFSETEAEQEALAVREAVPAELIKSLDQFAQYTPDALLADRLDLQFQAAGYRAGLVSAGSIAVALEGLRAVTGILEGPLASLPGGGMLLSFAFSLDFVDIIRRFEAK
jgi:tetratricopeptide (TPR) repeat protein